MTIENQLLQVPDNTVNANLVKDIVIQRLLDDGVITEEQANEYSEKWQMIVIKTNWFKRWMEKFGMSKDSYQYKFVKFED